MTQTTTTHFKTARARAWRNMMVSAINSGIERGLIGLGEGENFWAEKKDPGSGPWGRGVVFHLTIGGMPAAAFLGDADGSGAMCVHCVLYPKEGRAFLTSGKVDLSVGDAYAFGWLGRLREGARLERFGRTPPLRCRSALVEKVAALDIDTLGYDDRGRLMM